MKTKNRLLLGIAILLSILCIRARTVINLAENVTGILGTSQGGNGTSSPALTAGTNITFGPGSTWPNYTINASNTGGPTVLSGSAITPSDYEFKNGSTYYVWPPYYATTDPTGVSFSWINQGPATVSTTANGKMLDLSTASASGLNLRSASIGTNTTLTVAIVPLLYGGGGGGVNPGICVFFYQTSSSRLFTFNISYNNGPVIQLGGWWWNSPTSFGGVSFSYAISTYPQPVNYVLLREKQASSTCFFYYSVDGGNTWALIFSFANSGLFTGGGAPDKWGYGVFSNTTPASHAILASWVAS